MFCRNAGVRSLENGAELAKPGAAQKPAGGVQGRRKAGILVATKEAYALLELKQWGETRTNSRSCQGGCSLNWRVSWRYIDIHRR